MASVDQRSAADIEREIEDERNALTRTLDEIHDRLSFEALSSGFVDRVRDNGGEIGRSVVRSVKNNPIPLALTAVGVAWLIAGQRGGHTDPYRAAALPSSARRDYREPDSVVDPAPIGDAGNDALSRDESRWDRAVDRSQEESHDLKEDASHRVAEVSASIRRRARAAYASADELRQRMTHGTEGLSKHARGRVIAARTRAYEAQLRAERYVSSGREKATDLFEDQPLVAGALALAFGAAIGGLLPGTRRENAAFGEYRDRVFDEAERVYREERAKLEEAARDATREATGVARDVVEDVRADLEKGAERAGDIARTKLSEAGSEISNATGENGDDDGTDGKPRLRKV